MHTFIHECMDVCTYTNYLYAQYVQVDNMSDIHSRLHDSGPWIHTTTHHGNNIWPLPYKDTSSELEHTNLIYYHSQAHTLWSHQIKKHQLLQQHLMGLGLASTLNFNHSLITDLTQPQQMYWQAYSSHTSRCIPTGFNIKIILIKLKGLRAGRQAVQTRTSSSCSERFPCTYMVIMTASG